MLSLINSKILDLQQEIH